MLLWMGKENDLSLSEREGVDGLRVSTSILEVQLEKLVDTRNKSTLLPSDLVVLSKLCESLETSRAWAGPLKLTR